MSLRSSVSRCTRHNPTLLMIIFNYLILLGFGDIIRDSPLVPRLARPSCSGSWGSRSLGVFIRYRNSYVSQSEAVLVYRGWSQILFKNSSFLLNDDNDIWEHPHCLAGWGPSMHCVLKLYNKLFWRSLQWHWKLKCNQSWRVQFYSNVSRFSWGPRGIHLKCVVF